MCADPFISPAQMHKSNLDGGQHLAHTDLTPYETLGWNGQFKIACYLIGHLFPRHEEVGVTMETIKSGVYEIVRSRNVDVLPDATHELSGKIFLDKRAAQAFDSLHDDDAAEASGYESSCPPNMESIPYNEFQLLGKARKVNQFIVVLKERLKSLGR